MKKNIIIFSGEPESINAEIIYKSWRKLNKNLKKRVYIISNFDLLKKQFKNLKYNIKLKKLDKNISLEDYQNENVLKIINVNLKFKKISSIGKKELDNYIIRCLNLTHKYALKENVRGVINCPINKNHIKNFSGATEFFAKKCSVKRNSEVMLIKSKNYAVSPITTHIEIKNVSKNIKLKFIINKVKTIFNWYRKNLRKKPKLAILGLNPHNAELRKNSEEARIIIPSINNLRKKNINLDGPFSADTFFIKNFKNYDVVIGMFHDQVITPFKTLFKFDAINITLGLKYLRVSPDHGTAKDIVGKNKASPESLLNCINFINNYKK